MDRSFSLYLDIIRFLSALIVLLSHSIRFIWPHGPLDFMADWGHPAVLVFFILSGYVISYVTSERETRLEDYATARLARLYSVVLPALALTVALDAIGQAADPAAYAQLGAHDHPLVRVAAAASFMNAFWSWNIQTLSNSPFWSLPYEAWYYVAFGCAIYLRGRTRLGCLALAGIMMTPKILIYAPIWLGGVALHRHGSRLRLERWAAPLFIGSIVAFVALMPLGTATRHETPWLPFGFSPYDFPLAACVLVHLWAAQSLRLDRLQAWSRPIRASASISFVLYLTHLPLLFCMVALLPDWPLPIVALVGVTAALLFAAGLTGPTDRLRDLLRMKLPAWWQRARRLGWAQPEG